MVYPLSGQSFTPSPRLGPFAYSASSPSFGLMPSAGAFNLAKSTAQAMGETGPAMMGVRQFMGTLENNFLAQLVVSDLLAMVLPRTAVEMKERGLVAAQETLFREIIGTLTNTILAGSIGYGMAKSMQKNRMNLRAMDTQTWIESNTLEHYGKIVQNILTENPHQTPEQVRSAFYKTALSRLDSSDPIAKLDEFKHIFPNKGRLGQLHLNAMVDQMMGKQGGAPGNLEAQVYQDLMGPLQKKALASHLSEVRQSYFRAIGTAKPNEIQHKLLNARLDSAKAAWLKTQSNAIRLASLPEVRRKEKTLIEALYTYAVDHGKLSDQVYVLKQNALPGTQGTILNKLGIRSLKGELASMVHFDREFLTRALAHPTRGHLASVPVDSPSVLRRLFTPEPTSRWGRFLKNWLSLPKVADGLITMAYRAKLWVVLLPVLFTAMAGMLTVTANNWITRHRFHGQKFFPGEQVFMGPSGGRQL